MTESENESKVFCTFIAEPVKVDGVLDEWPAESFSIVLDSHHMQLLGNRQDPPVSGGDDDCSGKVAMAWDGKFLYVAAAVRDDELAPIDPDRGYGRPWEHDGLMLELHAPQGLRDTGRYGSELRLYPTDRAVLLGLSYYQDGMQPRSLPGQSHYVAGATDDGYVIEAAIELAALGYHDPRPGDRLKVAMILVDRDPGATGAGKFGQLIWQLGSGEIQDWAHMRLLYDKCGADTVVNIRPTGAGRSMAMKTVVEALRPDLVFKGVELLDQYGKVALHIQADQKVTEKTALTAVTEVDVSNLAVGTYLVQPVIEASGKRVGSAAPTVLNMAMDRLEAVVPEPVITPNRARTVLRPAHFHPPVSTEVNKDVYLAYLQEHVPTVLRPLVHNNFTRPWRHAPVYGFLAAYMYAQTEDSFYAEAAKAALESSMRWTEEQDDFGDHAVEAQWLMVHFMRKAGLLEAAQDERVRRFLVTSSRNACKGKYNWDAQPWRRGAGHSALGPAVARYYALQDYPEDLTAEETATWRKYFTLTWNDWWQHRDTAYNDTSYRALHLQHIFLCAYLMDMDEVFSDPEALTFYERLLHTIAPGGAVPHYGNTSGWGTTATHYAFFFEYIAARTGDGRFRRAAHRIFDYTVNHSENLYDYHGPRDEILHGIALAHMVADDSVRPVSPGRKSLLLNRKELLFLADDHQEEFGHHVFGAVLGPESVPDKIVFKSGDRPDDLWALVDLSDRAAHHQPAAPGNLIAMMNRHSVLLADQGYFDKTPDFHNVLLVEDLDGTRSDLSMKITVPGFYNRTRCAWARMAVENYHGWPLNAERQFMFVNHRFLVLKDTAVFRNSWTCRVGPVWQVQQAPRVGRHWAAVHLEDLFLTGLGLGRGMHRWKNPPWDLLIYHPQQDEYELEIINRFAEQPYRMLPVRVRYAWEGLAQPGQQLHFTTLLLPHAPTLEPEQYIENITILVDTPSLTIIHVDSGRDGEDWIVLNDSAETVSFGELETDAQQLHIWHGAEQDRGHVMAAGGTFVRFRNNDIIRHDAVTAVDEAF